MRLNVDAKKIDIFLFNSKRGKEKESEKQRKVRKGFKKL